MAKDKREYWAGFVDGNLAVDIYAGYYKEKMPALFASRRAARQEYQDVRKVYITEVV